MRVSMLSCRAAHARAVAAGVVPPIKPYPLLTWATINPTVAMIAWDRVDALTDRLLAQGVDPEAVIRQVTVAVAECRNGWLYDLMCAVDRLPNVTAKTTPTITTGAGGPHHHGDQRQDTCTA